MVTCINYHNRTVSQNPNSAPLVVEANIAQNELSNCFRSQFIESSASDAQSRFNQVSQAIGSANANRDRWVTFSEYLQGANAVSGATVPHESARNALINYETYPHSFHLTGLTDNQIHNVTLLLRNYQTLWESFANEHPQALQDMGLRNWRNQVTLYGLPLSEIESFIQSLQSCAQLSHSQAALLDILLETPIENGQARLDRNAHAPLTPDEVYSFYLLADTTRCNGESFLGMPLEYSTSEGLQIVASNGLRQSVINTALPNFVASGQSAAIREFISSHSTTDIWFGVLKTTFEHIASPRSVGMLIGLMTAHYVTERAWFSANLHLLCGPGQSHSDAWRNFRQFRAQEIRNLSWMRRISNASLIPVSSYILEPSLDRYTQLSPAQRLIVIVAFFEILGAASRQGALTSARDYIQNQACRRPEAVEVVVPAPQPEVATEPNTETSDNRSRVPQILTTSLALGGTAATYVIQNREALSAFISTFARGASTAATAELTIITTLIGISLQSRCRSLQNDVYRPSFCASGESVPDSKQ